jgi:hypothetical protein
MLDATPGQSYEGYDATLSPFGGPDEDFPADPLPFGFAPTPVKPDEASWWDDCGVVD